MTETKPVGPGAKAVAERESRTNRLTCADCRFCGIVAGDQQVLVNVCRRHPPVVEVHAIPTQQMGIRVQDYTVWPQVNARMDWCGDLEPKLHS